MSRRWNAMTAQREAVVAIDGFWGSKFPVGVSEGTSVVQKHIP